MRMVDAGRRINVHVPNNERFRQLVLHNESVVCAAVLRVAMFFSSCHACHFT